MGTPWDRGPRIPIVIVIWGPRHVFGDPWQNHVDTHPCMCAHALDCCTSTDRLFDAIDHELCYIMRWIPLYRPQQRSFCFWINRRDVVTEIGGAAGWQIFIRQNLHIHQTDGRYPSSFVKVDKQALRKRFSWLKVHSSTTLEEVLAEILQSWIVMQLYIC